MKISNLCHIRFTANENTTDFIDGGLPIVPLGFPVLIKEIAGVDPIQNAYLVNAKTKVQTQLTLQTLSPCSVNIVFRGVPCGIYYLILNKGFVNSETKSCNFQIIKDNKNVVVIRTTNFDDVRYRTASVQEYAYYYAYLSNFTERINESVVKYDDGKGTIIPLIQHTFKTYDFSTKNTSQHTINMLSKICNNDFINLRYWTNEKEKVFFELKRTSDAPNKSNYERTNRGTFSCSFIGEQVGDDIRQGLFVVDSQPIYLGDNIPQKPLRYVPISEFCHKITNIEWRGHYYQVEDYPTLKLDKVTEIPDNFLNFRKANTIKLLNSNSVRKIGKGFGSLGLTATAYFENVDSIGIGFNAKELKGLINFPPELVAFNPAKVSAKCFGTNLKLTACKLSTFEKLNVTISNLNHCTIDTLTDINFCENAVVDSCKIISTKHSGGIPVPTKFQLPAVKGLTFKNCEFTALPDHVGLTFNLDLTNFIGTIENSFHFETGEIQLTEATFPSYQVDNNSFVGCKVNSEYLKDQIDSIKRYNVASSGNYKNRIDISGTREGNLVNLEATEINAYSVELNNRLANDVLDKDDVLTFQPIGIYRHPEHFLESAKLDTNTPLDFRTGTHYFSDYFCNHLQIQKIQFFYSQFMELCSLRGFNPSCSIIEIYDDGQTFDLYYFALLGETLNATPLLKLESTLTDLYAKLTDLGYTNIAYLSK